VMILTVEDLFRRIEERKAESTIKVTLSMLEVYNETIRDLLSPEGTAQAAPGGLDLREDPNLGVVVAGLSEHTPETVEQVLQLLATGNGCAFNPPFLPSSCFQAEKAHKVLLLFLILLGGFSNRTQSATHMNATSSRSHAVLQVKIRQQSRTAGMSTQVKVRVFRCPFLLFPPPCFTNRHFLHE